MLIEFYIRFKSENTFITSSLMEVVPQGSIIVSGKVYETIGAPIFILDHYNGARHVKSLFSKVVVLVKEDEGD